MKIERSSTFNLKERPLVVLVGQSFCDLPIFIAQLLGHTIASKKFTAGSAHPVFLDSFQSEVNAIPALFFNGRDYWKSAGCLPLEVMERASVVIYAPHPEMPSQDLILDLLHLWGAPHVMGVALDGAAPDEVRSKLKRFSQKGASSYENAPIVSGSLDRRSSSGKKLGEELLSTLTPLLKNRDELRGPAW